MYCRIQTKLIARKDKSPNVHGRHQTIWQKCKKNWKTLIHAVSIYSQDIGMESDIEKCAMLVMKSGKRHITDGMEQPNQTKIRALGEKETYL